MEKHRPISLSVLSVVRGSCPLRGVTILTAVHWSLINHPPFFAAESLHSLCGSTLNRTGKEQYSGKSEQLMYGIGSGIERRLRLVDKTKDRQTNLCRN